MQGELFNPKNQAPAKEAKRKAIERVTRNANPDFLSACRAALEAVAREQSQFTTDAVWERYEQHSERPFQHEPRAVGPVMLQAMRDRVIAKVPNLYWNSTSARCHNRPKQVYRSLIYKLVSQ